MGSWTCGCEGGLKLGLFRSVFEVELGGGGVKFELKGLRADFRLAG